MPSSGRWLWGTVVACTLTVGCGGAGTGGSAFQEDDGGNPTLYDATTNINFGGDATIEDASPPSNCTPRTCAQAGANCGPIGDGCGNQIECGPCTAPQTCGGGGTPSVCGGTAACVPATCTTLAVNCGQQGDGCGNVIDCGTCTLPQTCGGGNADGGGGTPSVCGGSAGCIPLTTCPAGMNCGAVADGCGGLVQCAGDDGGTPCPSGTTCGGGGSPNTCGASNELADGGFGDADINTCVPIPEATACAGLNCGEESNGCGGAYTCGAPCTAPQTCGGGGTHSVCGGNSGCIPLTTCPSQMNCGVVADGCGGAVNCSPDGGTCPAPQTCGGGGQPNVCGGLNVLSDGGVIDGGVDLCVPISQGVACASFNCGLQSNGCGGTYDCGTCTAPETCGGGGTDSVCGGNSGCVPTTSCPSPMNCGVISNGCGGLVTCSPDGGTCPASETCGGGGQPNVCGALNVLSDGGIIDGGLNVCTPISKTVACSGIGCGQTGDGCGNLYNCGTCPSGQSCGGGGTPFQCGSAPCTPITSCPAGECGTIADGCGNTVTCASCPSGETCGGAGTPFQCGTPPCTPITTCPTGVNCGPWANGCGGVITSCGTCTGPETCGGAGGDAGSVCGSPACTPATSCPANVNCGTWPNGCDGGTISCGSCVPPLVCGATTPGQCGGGLSDGGTACSGPNCYLAECDAGATTSLTGYVFDPAGLDVLYNVVVYVPQSLPSALTHGPSCNTCGSLYTGNPLTAATTDATGKFVLTNVPVMANLPIVLQIGEWRRQMVIATPLTACVNNDIGMLADGGPGTPVFQLPSQENQPAADAAAGPWQGPGTIDDLPEIAVSTGGADSMECLLLRIGVSSSEYTSGAGGTGHIHIFQGSATSNEHKAAWMSSSTPSSKNNLWDSTTDLDPYDIVVLSCEGEETVGAQPTNLHTYATNGGRAFASHYHYKWFNQTPYSSENLGTWFTGSNPIYENANNKNQLNARIVQALADGGTPMKTWLGTVNALGGSAPAGELYIDVPRFNVEVTSSNTPSQNWIVPDDAGAYYYEDDSKNDHALPSSATEYFSFDTPTGGTGDASAPYCGRIVYSDLHVGAASNDYPTTSGNGDQPIVPTQCATGALSPQEKALEYMLFDLSSCVGSDSNLPTPPSCSPLTACPANYTCGPYPNGCGTGNLNCGSCEGGASCVDGKCTSCVPLTACPANYTCGEWPDGCGGTLQCGNCEGGTACINGACNTGCSAQTCASQDITCGLAGNGCGAVLPSCGSCPSGDACKNGTCVSACTPVTTCTAGECGTIGNGCGGTVTCPPCPGSETCGGGGVHFQCGQADANACVPLTCAEQHVFCGPAGDGCGGEIQCGQCDGGTCGGGGTPGVCGSPNCSPLTCGSLHCGETGDGCGGTLECGTCTPPLTCGGGGTNGVCGQGDANACIPNTTCTSCGLNGDGCGGTFNCPCPAGETCGGGGTAGVCGSSSCVPLTCAPLQCGQTGDGCGGVLNCIQCAAPESCGGGGVNGVCGEGDANLCVPNTTCTTCGLNGDGCGGTFNCPCPTGETCGGGGVAGACGSPVCTPKTCAQLNANCGQVADGCGGLTADCGTCTDGQTCGGGGTSNQCGAPQCTPETCQQLGANCGPVADGCGGIIQCGTCIAPDTCGGGGTPSQCGSGGIK